MENNTKRQIIGQVQYEAIEAGIWYILDNEGNLWRPIKFPKKLKKIGLSIKVILKESNIISFEMFGIPVQIVKYKIMDEVMDNNPTKS